MFGELRETITSLTDVVIRVGRSVRHARKGRWRRAVEALNAGSLGNSHAVASTYAGYVWALAPFLNDVYGLQEQVKDGFRRNGDLIRVSGFASQVIPAKECYLYSTNEYKYQGQVKSWSRVVYHARVKNEALLALSQLGVTNPLATAWELLPLSFVADWLLPIGDFLSALTGPLGTEFVSGFEDKVIEISTSVDFCQGGWPTFESGVTPHYNWEMFAFQRVVLTHFQSAALYIGSGLNQSVSRAIATVALLRLRAN